MQKGPYVENFFILQDLANSQILSWRYDEQMGNSEFWIDGLGQALVMALSETLSPFDVPSLVVQRLNNTLH